MRKTRKMLDIFVHIRSHKPLDRAIEKDTTYNSALKEQDAAVEELYKSDLSKEQKLLIDRAISATNQCGAIYGKIAYRLGMYDGIRLMSELNKFK